MDYNVLNKQGKSGPSSKAMSKGKTKIPVLEISEQSSHEAATGKISKLSSKETPKTGNKKSI